MKIKCLIILLVLIIPLSASRAGIGIEMGGSRRVPEPNLLAPISEKVDLTGKDSLEFKWSPHEGAHSAREYYDFRLYKGYDMVESTIIFKERLPGGQSSIKLEASLFEDGQVYTWGLLQSFYGSMKSRAGYSSFRVIKK